MCLAVLLALSLSLTLAVSMPPNLQESEVLVLLHVDNPVRVPPDDTPIERYLSEGLRHQL